MQNDFNILIPVTNEEGELPYNIVIAFTRAEYVSLGVTGYDKLLAVYRVFGPTISDNVK